MQLSALLKCRILRELVEWWLELKIASSSGQVNPKAIIPLRFAGVSSVVNCKWW